ncbi:MAG: aminotransferase class V-fold PLP-dependent enzyme [Elusimicrobiota bacterium]|jgi:isopenicillin-N epimerase
MSRFGRVLRRRWTLDPRVRYLNHGSFGAAPRPVIAEQDAWRRRMEREPMDLLGRELPVLLRRAAAPLAAFLGARADDLAFVENATAGVNAVLRSFPWRKGDELLLSDHAYPAVRNTALFLCARHGLRLRVARLPFPLRSEREVVSAFAREFSGRVRLVVADHVTSPSALVLPVRALAALCRRRGVPLLVDGAHAPGMLELDVPAVGADWYTGNCHKWLCAPKGCAFLWASRRGREGLHPAVISNRYGEGFPAEFDWCGTRDPSAWLSVGAALRFHRALGGAALRRRNRALALRVAGRLSAAWGVELPAPASCLGSMAALPLPLPGKAGQPQADALMLALRRRGFEVPVFHLDGRLLLRVSVQAYNEEADYRPLERLVPALLAKMIP